MKHVPQRSCIVCREQKDKAQLLRIVRDGDGNFAFDLTGKLPGRGAYVCIDGDCKRLAVEKKLLNRVYKTQLPQSVYDALAAQLGEIDEKR